MSRILLYCLFCLMAGYASAQGVGVNEDGSAPDPSAILDVKSTYKGMLLPRMNNEERDMIDDPAVGLMIFNIETGRINYFFDGVWYEVFGSVIIDPTCTFSQDFTGLSSLPPGWTTSDPTRWTVNSSNSAGGISPELRFTWESSETGLFWVSSGLIDMTTCSQPELTFKHYARHFGSTSFFLRVQTSLNGTSWTDRATMPVNADVGPTTWTVDLNALSGQSFYLRFVFDGNTLYIWEWFIDDIVITGG